jgi:hypothetical protein
MDFSVLLLEIEEGDAGTEAYFQDPFSAPALGQAKLDASTVK